jgi:outer membrane protein TolC
MSDLVKHFGVATLLLAVSACAARQERAHVAPVAPPVAPPKVSPAAPKPAPRPPAPFPPAPAARIAAPPQGVATVQFTSPPEELPQGVAIATKALTLDEVLQSVDLTFPMVQAAYQERAIAEGQQLAARGGFDLTVDGYSLAQPMGYYKMYRTGVTATQPLWRGGYAYGGYRIGDGNFPDWYGERQTNEGGEFKLGATVPLWRDRAIDKRRVAIAQSNLARAAAEPSIQAQLLEIDRAAAQSYWTWVAAGEALRVERGMLRVAVERNAAIKRRVEFGDLPGSEAVDNDRVVASRRMKVIASERKLQEAAIKLSLFLRSPEGFPLLPPPELLPMGFPAPPTPRSDTVPLAIEQALQARPEVRELNLLRQSLAVDLQAAENLLLPGLDANVWGSKDVGGKATPSGDKTPYEMEGGLIAEVPLQRREARGKIRAIQAKLAQLNAKQRFTNDKIGAEVRDAASALMTSYQRAQEAGTNVRLAQQMEAFERRRFELGDSNIFLVNQRELAAVEASLFEIESLADYYRSLAVYRTSLAERAVVRLSDTPR